MLSENIEQLLSTANNHAHFGRNEEFLAICKDLLEIHSFGKPLILKVCSLYLNYGFPSYANQCLIKALTHLPDDADLLLALANAQLQLGQAEKCQAIFKNLLNRFPSNPQILRNLIFFSEYLPSFSNQERLELAKKWGNLIINAVGGSYIKPECKNLSSRKIKIGYVSADFCQHTVGLLIKNILAKHNKDQFEVYCYSNGTLNDSITDFIAKNSHFIEVAQLSDAELANRIRSDSIDILIDLSGHTGGSRLTAFAYRPAPVQLSWLGYYATTGLECIDGVLLDRWHIYDEIGSQFIEPVILLPIGRWCYTPAIDPAPLITQPPCIKNGYITFGSFNNTLKYTPQVYAAWSKILLEMPNSKLILKWRTFNDAEFKKQVLDLFKCNGVDPSRVELRGPSFHINMLVQYNDIDIALDPFPFSGGATSCEALYMGVPVITWPQDRVVSRQTYAFLSSIGCSEFATSSEGAYIAKAVKLASDTKKITEYRLTLREKMIFSPFMQTKDFTHSLEEAFKSILRA